MKEQSKIPAPLPTPSPQDEHHGMGGSYVVDPQTGKRVLQERTNTPVAATETKE
jgi:hypothetical protein